MKSLMLGILSAFLLTLAVSAEAAGQTVANPTKFTFVASVDHTLVVDTIVILTRYDLVVFAGSTLLQTTPLGKPTPTTINEITVPLSGAGLPKNTLLTAFVDAVGPFGSSRSTVSNPFAFGAAPAAASNPRAQP